MNLSSLTRVLLGLAVALGLALTLVVWLYATERAFEVWEKLRQASPVFMFIYLGAILIFAVGFVWLSRRIFGKTSRRARGGPARHLAPAASEAEVQARIEQAETLGADVAPALNELQSLRERRAANKLYVALFGEISTGKSSLIKALLPNCHPLIDPRGGTTRKLSRYLWTHPGGDEVILTDMPGLKGNEEELDHMSREEARRSHLVIYLVNGDLTRDQYQELKLLIALGKPLILALNKADRLSPADLDAIRQRLALRLGEHAEVAIVPVTAGGKREVVKVYPDGQEEIVVQDIPPRVDKLVQVLERHLTEDTEQLERRLDTAVFRLASDKLEGALVEHRRTRSEQLVSEYTRKAVFGALVAVGPGTDIIIQGYLGVSLIKGLCEIHEVPAKEMEISRFLKLASKNVIKTLPMLLAISGNAFKAFPGIGTVAGGLLHAVGYGLIFESLGKAVTATLAQGRGLETTPALRIFEEDLIDNLETRARRLAKLALAQEQERNGPSKSQPGPQ